MSALSAGSGTSPLDYVKVKPTPADEVLSVALMAITDPNVSQGPRYFCPSDYVPSPQCDQKNPPEKMKQLIANYRSEAEGGPNKDGDQSNKVFSRYIKLSALR